MSEDALIDVLNTIREDIHWMRRDVARMARDSYREDLERVANTSVRHEIWRLCDGSRSSDEIAKKIGITTRSVQYFMQDTEKAGLIIHVKRGYPKRTDSFDEIPGEWKPYKKTQETPNVETKRDSNE